MLILLPPSESKRFGTLKSKLDLSKLGFADLNQNRKVAIDNLVKLSATPKKAQAILGLSKHQSLEIEHNKNLWLNQTSPAIDIYDGVLFDAFDYQNLSAPAKSRADNSILISSALFGLLRLQDPIPHYRLSGDAVLPKLGKISKFWSSTLEKTMSQFEPDLLIDMRSGTYAKFWQPGENLVSKTVQIKIMTRVGRGKTAKKIAISHNNKLTKGLILKALANSKENLTNEVHLLKFLEKHGWPCELSGESHNSSILEVFV